MASVKMIAADSGVERDFTPEHAQNILKHQVANHTPAFISWALADERWEFNNGKLSLKKTTSNGNQSDTGISDKAPQRKRDSKGADPQP